MNLFISIRFSSQRTFSSYFIIVVSNFDLKCLNLFCNNTPPPPTAQPVLPPSHSFLLPKLSNVETSNSVFFSACLSAPHALACVNIHAIFNMIAL